MFFYGKLDVLHVAIVLFEKALNAIQLSIDERELVLERIGRTRNRYEHVWCYH